jgi:hypothetical protein
VFSGDVNHKTIVPRTFDRQKSRTEQRLRATYIQLVHVVGDQPLQQLPSIRTRHLPGRENALKGLAALSNPSNDVQPSALVANLCSVTLVSLLPE